MSYMEGREHNGPLVSRSTVMAVVLNGITTVVGFGSMMTSHHRGIFGLGLLLTIGTTCALVASLVVLPVVLRRLQKHAAPVMADSISASPAG